MKLVGFLLGPVTILLCLNVVHNCILSSQRGTRDWSSDGKRKTQENPQAAHHLLELPARRAAAPLPEGAVSGAAGESRARRTAGAHADTGNTGANMHLQFC